MNVNLRVFRMFWWSFNNLMIEGLQGWRSNEVSMLMSVIQMVLRPNLFKLRVGDIVLAVLEMEGMVVVVLFLLVPRILILVMVILLQI